MNRVFRRSGGSGAHCVLLGVLLGLSASDTMAQDFPAQPPPQVVVSKSAKPVAEDHAKPVTEPSSASNPREPVRASESAKPVDAGAAAGETPLAALSALGQGERGSASVDPAPAADPLAAALDPAAAAPNPTAAAVALARAERAALPPGPQPIEILQISVLPGTRAEARWKVGESFDGSVVETPVVVVNGAQPGPRLCLTAGVHGDELNGVEVVRRMVGDLDPTSIDGTVIAVPIVNLLGFARGSRYLPDRRDLNRFFPGFAQGSAASRMAFNLFRSVIVHCDALVDFHTGSFNRSNLPQVRGDLRNPDVLAFTRRFGATPVLHSPGLRGMLRLAATDFDIPAVTFEVGGPYRLEPEKIDAAVQAIKTLMHQMGMTEQFRLWSEPQAIFYESRWVRVDQGGMLFSDVALGDRVREGQRLGKVVDPIRNLEHEINAPFAGRVIGMALNQVVLPGYAAYHLGIETTDAKAAEDAVSPDPAADPLDLLEGEEIGGQSPEVPADSDETDPDRADE